MYKIIPCLFMKFLKKYNGILKTVKAEYLCHRSYESNLKDNTPMVKSQNKNKHNYLNSFS